MINLVLLLYDLAQPKPKKSYLISLLANASSGIPNKQLPAIQAIKKLLVHNSTPLVHHNGDIVDDIIEIGMVPILIQNVSEFNK